MERIVLDGIPFSPDPEDIGRELRLKPGSEAVSILERLCREAEPLGRPAAIFGVAFIGDRGEDFVVIDGERFSSRVLAVNVAQVHRVFPMLATCGPELHEWGAGFTDDLERFLAEAVKGAALKAALLAYEAELQARFAPGKVSTMTPGSLPDWPLSEQAPLFRLLGDTVGAAGVRLLDTMFMLPNITVSGISFASVNDFQSCQLCPREKCPGRRAPHDPELFRRRYS